jgi:hypothetical protein
MGDGAVGGVLGEGFLWTVVAHLVIDSMRSVRTLACSSEAEWGAIRTDSPLGGVTVEAVIVAGVGLGVKGAKSVSVSFSTRTRLLIVSRIFSTGGMGVTGSTSFKASPVVGMREAAIKQ